MYTQIRQLVLFPAITIMALSGCGQSQSNFDKWMDEAKGSERQGDYTKAELLLKAAAGAVESERSPELKKAIPYIELASCYKQETRFQDEESMLKQVIYLLESSAQGRKTSKTELDGAIVVPLIQLARNQKKQGKLAEAKSDLQRVHSIAENNNIGLGESSLASIMLGQVLIQSQDYDEADKVVKQMWHRIAQLETAAAAVSGTQEDHAKINVLLAEVKKIYFPIFQVQQTLIAWKLGQKPAVPSKDIDFSNASMELWSPELISMWGEFLVENKEDVKAAKVYGQLAQLCNKTYGPKNPFSTVAKSQQEKLMVNNGKVADIIKAYF